MAANPQQLQQVTEHVYTAARPAHGMPTVIEGGSSLVVFDPGYDSWKQLKERHTLEGSPFHQVQQFSKERDKPVSLIVLSHAHGDHTLDLTFYTREWQGLEIMAHKNNRLPQRQDLPIDYKVGDYKGFEIDGLDFTLINTPGHTVNGEDISLYFPEQSIIFTGDLLQPHGLPYSAGDHETWLPFYSQGDDYLVSLQRVLEFKPKLMQTCHDGTYRDIEAIRTNIQIVERTQELADTLVADHPHEDQDTIVDWIAKTIAHERGVPNHKVPERMEAGKVYFDRHDRHGIDYFVKKAMQQSENQNRTKRTRRSA